MNNNTINTTIITPTCAVCGYQPTSQQAKQLQKTATPGQTITCPKCGAQATWTADITTITPKCDHCGHKTHPIPASQARQHLGMTCPQCGQTMISEHDVATVETLLHLLTIINQQQ